MSQITQRGATSPFGLQANGTFQSSTDVSLATLLGTRWDMSDGGQLVLVGTSSATTTVAGKLYQDAALIADHQGLVVTAFTAYGTSGGVLNSGSQPATVTATLGGAAATLKPVSRWIPYGSVWYGYWPDAPYRGEHGADGNQRLGRRNLGGRSEREP